MELGENGLYLARCRPPRKGHRRPPRVIKQAYRWEVGAFSPLARDAGRETNVLAAREVSLKLGGSCGVREQAVASSSSVVSKR